MRSPWEAMTGLKNSFRACRVSISIFFLIQPGTSRRVTTPSRKACLFEPGDLADARCRNLVRLHPSHCRSLHHANILRLAPSVCWPCQCNYAVASRHASANALAMLGPFVMGELQSLFLPWSPPSCAQLHAASPSVGVFDGLSLATMPSSGEAEAASRTLRLGPCPGLSRHPKHIDHLLPAHCK